jgi:hypothetical protein
MLPTPVTFAFFLSAAHVRYRPSMRTATKALALAAPGLSVLGLPAGLADD